MEFTDFVQYRPETAFDNMQLDVVRVKRDRKWFEEALPVLKQFIDDLEDIKQGKLNPPDDPGSLGIKVVTQVYKSPSRTRKPEWLGGDSD